MLGVDQSVVVMQPEVEDKSDVIATASGSADLVAVRWVLGFAGCPIKG